MLILNIFHCPPHPQYILHPSLLCFAPQEADPMDCPHRLPCVSDQITYCPNWDTSEKEQWRFTNSAGQTRGPDSVGIWPLQCSTRHPGLQLLPGSPLLAAASWGAGSTLGPCPSGPGVVIASHLGPQNCIVPLTSLTPTRVLVNSLFLQLHFSCSGPSVSCQNPTDTKLQINSLRRNLKRKTVVNAVTLPDLLLGAIAPTRLQCL